VASAKLKKIIDAGIASAKSPQIANGSQSSNKSVLPASARGT
jgi:hypothetical protein